MAQKHINPIQSREQVIKASESNFTELYNSILGNVVKSIDGRTGVITLGTGLQTNNNNELSIDTSVIAQVSDLSNYVDKANAQTISGTKTFSANQILNNNIALQGKNIGGTAQDLIKMNNTNKVVVGNGGTDVVANVSGALVPSVDVAKDLGNSSYKWRYLYLSSAIKTASNTFSLPSATGTLALQSEIPTALSQLSNDSGYLLPSDIDQVYDGTSANAQSGVAIAGALSPIIAVAQGKTASYVIQSQSDITGTKDADDEYTIVTSITDVTVSDLSVGDIILIKDLNVPDYWVSKKYSYTNINLFDNTVLLNASGWQETDELYYGSPATMFAMYGVNTSGFPNMTFDANTQYTIQYTVTQETGISGTRFRVYYTDNTYTDGTSYGSGLGGKVTFNTTAGKTISKITMAYTQGSGTISFYHIMVVKGVYTEQTMPDFGNIVVDLCKMETTKVDLTNYVTTNTAQTISAVKTFSANILLNNTIKLQAKDTGDTARNLIGIGNTNNLQCATIGDIGFTGGIECNGKLLPSPSSMTNSVNDLGASTQRWKDIYLSGSLSDGTHTWAMPTTSGTFALASQINKTNVGLSNVDNVQQYSVSNPPPYPVTSVNSQTGAVILKTSDLTNDSGYITSAVTSLGGSTGAITLGSGLSISGNVLSATATGGVTSIGGKTGAITLNSPLSINSSNQMSVDLSTCLKNNSQGTITATNVATPLYLKGDGSTLNVYLGFKKSDGTSIGAFGVNTQKKPIFYDNTLSEDKVLAYEDDLQDIYDAIPTATSDLTNDSGFITSAVTSIGGKNGAITLGTGLSIDSNKVLSATGSAPTNMVTTDTTQTISGQKTFTSSIYSNADIHIGDSAGNSKAIYFDKNGVNSAGIVFYAPDGALVNKGYRHYFRKNDDTNGIIINCADKNIIPENDNEITLGSTTKRWNGIYANTPTRTYGATPKSELFMTNDLYNTAPSSNQSAEFLTCDKNGQWETAYKTTHNTGNTVAMELVARSAGTNYYGGVRLEQDGSATADNQSGKVRFIPHGNSTTDLGSYNNRWRNLFTGGGIFDYGSISQRGVDANSNYAGYYLIGYTSITNSYNPVHARITMYDWDTQDAMAVLDVHAYFGFSNNVKTLTGKIGVTESGGAKTPVNYSANNFFLVCRTTNTSDTSGTNRVEIWYKQTDTYSRYTFKFNEDVGNTRTDALSHWVKVKVSSATDQSYVSANTIKYLDGTTNFPTFIPTASWSTSVFQTTNYPTASVFNNNLTNWIKAYRLQAGKITNENTNYEYTLPSYTGTLGIIDKNTISATYIGNITTSVSLTSVITANGTYMLIPNNYTGYGYGSLYNSGSILIYFNHPLIVEYNGNYFSFSTLKNNATSITSQGIPKANVTAFSCKIYKIV